MINQAACPGSRSNPGILDWTLVVGELMSSVGIDSNLHTCRILVATHLFLSCKCAAPTSLWGSPGVIQASFNRGSLMLGIEPGCNREVSLFYTNPERREVLEFRMVLHYC